MLPRFTEDMSLSVFTYNYYMKTHFGYCTKQKLSTTGDPLKRVYI
jgi:hypothetical protein